jgi:hypothetical protein
MTIPDPLTPAECNLQDFAFMPLDVARLRDSDLAANETPEACWAAVLLWAASWHQVPAASIPNDDRWIAKQAGYAQRGKIAREWADVRPGALRGWVECSDGRLYHPVVAEKAREAWQAKVEQRWRSECARIKKHNERHPGADVTRPTFEEWIAAGCPSGHPLPVPRDTGNSPRDTGRDNSSKGQGEGQGQGQPKEENPSGSSAARPPRATRKCPADFTVTDDMAQWAKAEAPSVNVERETEKFRDHTFTTAKSDWPATWRNWMRRASERGGASPDVLQRRAAPVNRHAAAAAGIFGRSQPNPSEVIDV